MPDALFCAAKVRKSPQHAHFYSEKINFAGMKRRFFLIFVLLTGAFSALAQIRVEMNNGGAQLRPLNLSDYDRHEEPFALTHADSVDYQSHVVRAYNYLATDSLPQARTHLKQALKITNKAPGTWILQHTLGRIEMAEGNYVEAVGFRHKRTYASTARRHTSNLDTHAKHSRTSTSCSQVSHRTACGAICSSCVRRHK